MPSDHDDRYVSAVEFVFTVLGERAPTDIDIEAGTADAPWWLALRDAIDKVDDRARAAVDVERVARERAEQQLAAITALIEAAKAVAAYVETPRGREMNPTERTFVTAVHALLDAEEASE